MRSTARTSATRAAIFLTRARLDSSPPPSAASGRGVSARAWRSKRVRKIDLTNFRVATSETARQISRRIALNFLRRHHPMSRADLARRLGLQRSTVSAIVDQLIDEGWVMEGAIGRLAARGRRP